MTDNQMGFPSRRTITTVNRKDPVTESLHLVGTALQCVGDVMRLILSLQFEHRMFFVVLFFACHRNQIHNESLSIKCVCLYCIQWKRDQITAFGFYLCFTEHPTLSLTMNVSQTRFCKTTSKSHLEVSLYFNLTFVSIFFFFLFLSCHSAALLLCLGFRTKPN